MARSVTSSQYYYYYYLIIKYKNVAFHLYNASRALHFDDRSRCDLFCESLLNLQIIDVFIIYINFLTRL